MRRDGRCPRRTRSGWRLPVFSERLSRLRALKPAPDRAHRKNRSGLPHGGLRPGRRSQVPCTRARCRVARVATRRDGVDEDPHGGGHCVCRAAAGHLRAAQEGVGVPRARLCRGFCPVVVRGAARGGRRRGGRQDIGVRRRRPLFQRCGDPDDPAPGGGERGRRGCWSDGMDSVDPGDERGHPQAPAALAASSSAPATIPAAPTAISASSTMSPMAGRRRAGDRAIWRHTKTIAAYPTIEAPPVPLDRIGDSALGGMRVDVIDPVADYAELMERVFDFDRLRDLFRGGFRLRFDAMNAVTGPYAREIFERRLGAPAGTVVNAEPMPDFGGASSRPEPDPCRRSGRGAGRRGRTRSRRRLGRRRRPQPDRRARSGRRPERQPRRARRQCPADSVVRHGPPRRRALDADEPGGRPRRRRARHPVLRDADRVEIFRRLARCRPDRAVRRGECRHRLRPSARKGRGVGGAVLAQHPRRSGGDRRPTIVRDHWRRYGRDFYVRHDYEGLPAEHADRPDRAAARVARRSARPRFRRVHGRQRRRFRLSRPGRWRAQPASRHPHRTSPEARASSTGCRAPEPKARRCGFTSKTTSPIRRGIGSDAGAGAGAARQSCRGPCRHRRASPAVHEPSAIV